MRDFAPHHRAFWEWLWGIGAARPRPFVAIWPRGGAKSTSAELATVAIGARRIRPYALYICQTQEQADDHVQNVAGLLESPRVAEYYPDLAEPLLNKFGNSKGWRRNRLRTASGFTIDAMGLDSAARGAKVDDDRPGWIVLDDLDGELDSLGVTEKKIKTLTRKLLPAGAMDAAVLAVQNLVHAESIFSRFADGRADFLNDRIVSGPHPAIADLMYDLHDGRYVITGGAPTWAGQDLARCQEMIDDFGLTAFLAECQHDVDAPPGGMFDHLVYRHCARDAVPELVRTAVWVDPAVTSTDKSDSMGIQADGVAADGTIYRLFSWEARATPLDAITRAVEIALEIGATSVGIETDQGGDTWESVYREAVSGIALAAGQSVPWMKQNKAGAGYGPKAHRASQMLAAYERGRFVHVEGTHTVLERALKRFPAAKPFDLVDAAFWAWHDLDAGDVTYAPFSLYS